MHANPRRLHAIVTVLLACLIQACATMKLDPPRVSLVDYSPIKINGFEASTTLKLRLFNPNRVPLPLSSMNYQIHINGHPLLSGITSDLPTIAARSDGTVELGLNINLFSAPKFLLDLMNSPKQSLRYDFTSTIDLKGALPSFDIQESGELPLKQ